MSLRYKWDSIGLEIEESEVGLIVNQEGQSYLARNWAHTNLLEQIINLAIQYGLTYLIRHTHPRPSNRLPEGIDGVEYIGFSKSPDDRWVFVVDQKSYSTRKGTESKKRVCIHQATFE